MPRIQKIYNNIIYDTNNFLKKQDKIKNTIYNKKKTINNISKYHNNKLYKNDINNQTIYIYKNNNNNLTSKYIDYANPKQRFELSFNDKLKKTLALLEEHHKIFNEYMMDFYISLSRSVFKNRQTQFGGQTIVIAKKFIQEVTNINKDICELYKNVNQDIFYYINQINRYLNIINNAHRQIKEYNQIQVNTGINQSKNIEPLIAIRNKYSNELTEILGTTTNISNNNLIISLNKQYNLIDDSKIANIIAILDPYYNNIHNSHIEYNLGYIDPTTNREISLEPLIITGHVAGILYFRKYILDLVNNKIGQIITSFTKNFNEIHQSGIDITNYMGKRFFSETTPIIIPNKYNNKKDHIFTSWNSFNHALPEKYYLTFLGNNKWKINTDDTNQKTVDYDTIINEHASSIIFNGIKVTYKPNTLREQNKYIVHNSSDIINNLYVEATPNTNIALSKEWNYNFRFVENIEQLILLHREKIVNQSETCQEAYANLKNFIQKKIDDYKLNKPLNQSIIHVLPQENEEKTINEYHSVNKINKT
ncbi:MAG: FlgK family flagellar hook-associated protein [Buchnera aphidicola (Eriosoma harunire)]